MESTADNVMKRFEQWLKGAERSTEEVFSIAVRIFRRLKDRDRDGVVLECISQVLEKNIKEREDSVSVLTNMLHDDKQLEIVESFENKRKVFLDDPDVDIEEYYNRKWSPCGKEFQRVLPRQSRRSGDLVTLLVNIVGGIDGVVQELNQTIRERVLQKELESVCGDSGRKACEMSYWKKKVGQLRSKFGGDRIDAEGVLSDFTTKRVHSAKKGVSVSARVLSSHLWGDYEDLPPATVPETLGGVLSPCQLEYSKRTPPKRFEWNHYLGGSVKMSVKQRSGEREVELTPTETVVLFYFQEKKTLALDEVSGKMDSDFLSAALERLIEAGLVASVCENSFRLVD
ncbi:MAG: anaphase-promoting complex subunit 2-related protein [Amphiamblys sp. WSBS2006]|nr:MAG: anaphase-promoting complex subunit 2-related protein [Amphiamblys sp. WSBS2006]